VSESMFVGILRCRDCGTEVNRTRLLTEQEKGQAALFSAFAAGHCPKGCRSTFSDLNINTTLSWESSEPEAPVPEVQP